MFMLQTNSKVIKNNVGLINLVQELGNISKACKVMGFSRDTFYRYQEAVETGGVDALMDKSRRRPNRKNRVPIEVEEAVIRLAIEYPAYGQVRATNELRKEGIVLSPAGVRCVWMRNNVDKRLRALEEKITKEGIVLTEKQLLVFEQKKDDREAHGEIETEHPGYLGSQDTFYIGTIKGVGRIYQQTFVDTDSKVAFAKLYNDIDHTKTKVKSPQTNGIVERFHRTILEEFYQVAFRKKIFNQWKRFKSTWTSGLIAIIKHVLIKERYAVDEHQCRRLSMD